MKTPVINIQEAFELSIKVIDAGNMPKQPKINPPYTNCFLIYKVDGCVILSKIEQKPDCITAEIFAAFNSVFKSIGFATINYDLKIVLEAPEELRNTINQCTGVIVFSLNLMNCKNIKYVPYGPNTQLSRQVKRHMERKNKSPYLKYEILEIQPMREKTITHSKSANELENNKRLHTVRGHFKTFTQENPLFGKLTGTYWWGDCVKGNAQIGLLEKDYNIQIDPEVLNKLINEIGG